MRPQFASYLGIGDRYLHSTPIHLSLIGDKVWIQYDDTEEGIANDLTGAGVSKSDIFLDFVILKLDNIQGLLLPDG